MRLAACSLNAPDRTTESARMRLMLTQANQYQRCEAGVAWVEVRFGAVMIETAVIHLFWGFSQGFAVSQLACERPTRRVCSPSES